MWSDTRPTSMNSEIWVPDVAPYNSYYSMADTLDPAPLRVLSDGRVYLSRPGNLDVMCKFSGLVAFPFDVLKCQIEFGGWLMSAGHQGLLLGGGGTAVPGSGFQFAAQEATSGSSYQEFTIANVTAERVNYVYPCCPNEPWPAILYTVSLDRANSFYTVVIVLPTMIITVLSFAVFFLPPESGDALGYGITIIVVVILMQVVMIDFLPICAELLWINWFILSNTFFCMLSLFQSCMTIVVESLPETYYSMVSYLWPAALSNIFSKRSTNSEAARKQTKQEREMMRLLQSSTSIESVAGVTYRALVGETDSGDTSSFTKIRQGIVDEANLNSSVRVSDSVLSTPLQSNYASATPGSKYSLRPGLREDPENMSDEDRLRFVYFENLCAWLVLDPSPLGTCLVPARALLSMPLADPELA